MNTRSNHFVELKLIPGPIEVVEGTINEALEELQKIPNVRINHVYTKPMVVGEEVIFFVQINGRRLIHTQKKSAEDSDND